MSKCDEDQVEVNKQQEIKSNRDDEMNEDNNKDKGVNNHEVDADDKKDDEKLNKSAEDDAKANQLNNSNEEVENKDKQVESDDKKSEEDPNIDIDNNNKSQSQNEKDPKESNEVPASDSKSNASKEPNIKDNDDSEKESDDQQKQSHHSQKESKKSINSQKAEKEDVVNQDKEEPVHDNHQDSHEVSKVNSRKSSHHELKNNEHIDDSEEDLLEFLGRSNAQRLLSEIEEADEDSTTFVNYLVSIYTEFDQAIKFSIKSSVFTYIDDMLSTNRNFDLVSSITQAYILQILCVVKNFEQVKDKKNTFHFLCQYLQENLSEINEAGYLSILASLSCNSYINDVYSLFSIKTSRIMFRELQKNLCKNLTSALNNSSQSNRNRITKLTFDDLISDTLKNGIEACIHELRDQGLFFGDNKVVESKEESFDSDNNDLLIENYAFENVLVKIKEFSSLTISIKQRLKRLYKGKLNILQTFLSKMHKVIRHKVSYALQIGNTHIESTNDFLTSYSNYAISKYSTLRNSFNISSFNRQLRVSLQKIVSNRGLAELNYDQLKSSFRGNMYDVLEKYIVVYEDPDTKEKRVAFRKSANIPLEKALIIYSVLNKKISNLRSSLMSKYSSFLSN